MQEEFLFARDLLYSFILRNYVAQNFCSKPTGNAQIAVSKGKTSARSETITETRGILSIYVIIDTSLLIYGITHDTVQRAGRKNLEEEEEEEEEENRRVKKGKEKGEVLCFTAERRMCAGASIYRRARI